jgi:Zn-dependent M28 family amino/carboxypeptidase
VDIGERTTKKPEALERARKYVEDRLIEIGYKTELQTYDALGESSSNVEAHLGDGKEIVVVGAHYDSAIGAAGADDNASGVAAMIEIARTLEDLKCARQIRFVAFVNEEMPHFRTGTMGSKMYADRAVERGDRIVAMLSLESIGYYSDAPGSQTLPFPMNLVYPDRGDFLGFVANTSSRALVRDLVGEFRKHAELPSQGGAVPESTFGARFSDHAPFWDHDIPAVMVTDTAFMRNPHYHTAHDLPEHMDFDRMTRAVVGLEAAIKKLVCDPA